MHPLLIAATLLGVPFGLKAGSELIDEVGGTDILGHKRDARNLAKYQGDLAVDELTRSGFDELRARDIGRRADQFKPVQMMEDPNKALDYELGVREAIEANSQRLGGMAQVLDEDPSLEELVLRMGYNT